MIEIDKTLFEILSLKQYLEVKTYFFNIMYACVRTRNYNMTKKSWLIFYSKFDYNIMGQYFLDIQYLLCLWVHMYSKHIYCFVLLNTFFLFYLFNINYNIIFIFELSTTTVLLRTIVLFCLASRYIRMGKTYLKYSSFSEP